MSALPPVTQPPPGRGWARTGFFLGIGVSVAGNIAHTWHPTAAALALSGQTADQWEPEPGAQAAAAFFPIALLVTVEILSRVRWAKGWRSWIARYGGAGLVAGVAAVVSYLHLRGLLQAYGEDEITSNLGPLSIDGLMIVAGFALIAIGSPTPAAEPGESPPAQTMPALPEYEVSLLRDRSPLELGQAHTEQPRQDNRSPRRRRPAMAVATTPARRRRRPQTTTAAPAIAPVLPTPAAPAAPADPELPRLVATAHDRFAEVLATGETPSVNKIRAKLRVGHPRARAIHDALAPA